MIVEGFLLTCVDEDISLVIKTDIIIDILFFSTGVSCVTSESIGMFILWVLRNFKMCCSVIEYLWQDNRHEHQFEVLKTAIF